MFKPMLAAKCDDLSVVQFPVMLSPKLDGVRAVVQNGVVLSRSLKPIPNPHVQRRFRHLEGCDGELIVGHPYAHDVFRTTTSGVMSQTGEPDVQFYVFDNFIRPATPWWLRLDTGVGIEPYVVVVPQTICYEVDTILDLEAAYLNMGYEGVMLRARDGSYKSGRSTLREGLLLKVKRFTDDEAEVLYMEERMHNGNEATTNELGRTARSSHQANMVPTGTMGALIVRDLKTGVVFSIGTGFDDAERARWWSLEDEAVGRIVKYKHFAVGSKDKPRFPVYVGERSQLDLDL